MCPGVNSAYHGGKGGRCVRLTTYHPCNAEPQEIRGLNLPGPPWAISTACCGRDLYIYLYLFDKETTPSSDVRSRNLATWHKKMNMSVTWEGKILRFFWGGGCEGKLQLEIQE